MLPSNPHALHGGVAWNSENNAPVWVSGLRGYEIFCYLDRLIVVPVHVSDEEVEDCHVHDVQEPAAAVVRLHLFDKITVILKIEKSCSF